MLISYRWLGRHVDLTGVSPVGVVEDLTLSTAEVEGLERFAPVLDDVVVGHVVTREKHPDADKLSVCTVDVGGPEQLQIVCGAPNVRKDLKVAVVQVGQSLPDGEGGSFKIKKSKIRGVESRGMICSERELGLGEDHDGIWELPDDSEIGKPVAEALGYEDWVIEIDNKSLTHRPDLWGHRGIAGEIAAIRGLELKPLDLELPATGDGTACPVRIESEACSRYLALPIEGVRAERSPDWLRVLLIAVGQRPLDLLVDVSNFVMLDLGQPNHLFDRNRISPEGILVRDARAGERMTTLDGVERDLLESDLLICSGDEPVALAGIMGGEGSKVADDTDALLLEVATFHPAVVRRTSARLALRTDASARFEKHLDPTLPLKAAAHLVHVLRGIQPDLRLPAPLTDAGEWTDPALTVELRPERVRAVLGASVEDDEIARILTALGFTVERGGATWTVGVPSARATKDVTIEEDLIEEVGRLYLYGRIPEQSLVATLEPPTQDPERLLVRRLSDRLAGGARFHEAMTHNFQTDELLEELGLFELPHVEVTSPMSEGLSKIRRSVAPSLIGLLRENLRRRPEVRLFEVGRGYISEEQDDRSLPREVLELALVLAQPKTADGGFNDGALQRLKAVVLDVVSEVGCTDLAWTRAEESPSWAHPGRSALATAGEDGPVVARLSGLDPALVQRWELEADVAVATLEVAVLAALDAEDGRRGSYRPIPRFPGVKIDVALAVDEGVTAGSIQAAIERAGKGLVAGTELFDLYAGEQVGAGKKSLAWHVLLQAPDKTLSDKDGQRFLGRLEREIEALGGILRRE